MVSFLGAAVGAGVSATVKCLLGGGGSGDVALCPRLRIATYAALLGDVCRILLATAACRQHHWQHIHSFYIEYLRALAHCCL